MDVHASQDPVSDMPDDAAAKPDDQVGAVTRLPPGPEGFGGSSSTATGTSGLLAQFQHLIDQVVSAPVTREVAAKAAELAAVAAERAGPAARSIAAKTEVVGQSIADRAATFASSMRHDGDVPVESAPSAGGTPGS